MKWTDIPAGELHAAEQRLRVALGYEASDIVGRINQDSAFTLSLSRLMARGEVPPPSNWTEKDGIIYFTVESTGRNGHDWSVRLHQVGFEKSADAEETLRSPDFKPGLGTYKIAVMRSPTPSHRALSMGDMLKHAEKKGLTKKPPVDVGCLIREKFLDIELREMGLGSIMVMHEGIRNDDGYGVLLTVDAGRSKAGGPFLGGYELVPQPWSPIAHTATPIGFAFLDPEN